MESTVTGGAAGPVSRRIALVQMRVGEDPAANLARAIELIGEAAARGADLVCLPELFRTPYFCQREDATLFDFAEPVPGPTTAAIAAAARRHGVVVVASLFERRAPGIAHNTAAVIDADGSLAGIYRKMHIPDDPGYYEKYYFTPGDLGFRAIDTRAGRIGVLICWDQWFPEAARLVALAGAEVILYPTAIGWHPAEKQAEGEAQRDAWRTVQRGHAIANGVYVAAVNRVGLERPDPTAAGLEFWGTSFCCDPQGVLLAEAGTAGEEVLVVEIDRARLEEVRRNWPFLRDRRIDAYGGLTSRFLDAQPSGNPQPVAPGKAPDARRTNPEA
ncbi:MAG: carbon-nitrogen hydrolase [Candidatus Methylomirabilia bacterium]